MRVGLVESSRPSPRQPSERADALALLALILAALLAGCARPLPEEGSASAVLYRERCGVCHRAYDPGVLKFPTWQMILPRMETHMREVGRPPLAEVERVTILDYLRRNST